jgi:hypothetical protein
MIVVTRIAVRRLQSGLDKYVSSELGFAERRSSLPGNVRAATSLGERRLGTGSKVSGSRFLQSDGEVSGDGGGLPTMGTLL